MPHIDPLLAAGALTPLDYLVVAVYVIAMMAIGIRFSRGDQNTEDYLLGGRSMPAWLAGVSYLMTLLSTISMVAIPGEAYTHGVTMALQTLFTPVASLLGFHLFVRFYFRTKTFTPFDYLERRFDARIRALAAGFYWLTRVVYLGLALYATAIVFEGVCGWPKWLTILLTGGVGIAYTVLGGLSAVAWTDFIQFFVLVGGLGALLGKILWVIPGGAAGVLTFAFANNRGMPEVHDPSFYSLSPFVRMSLWGLILFIINDHLFYNSSDQMALQRLLSTSSYRQARRSLISCLSLQVPVLIALWFTGLCIFAFYGLLPPEQRPQDGKIALYQFIGTQLPAPLPGLIIAAMLAAVMSTIAGGFNSLSTVATVDFYDRFIRPNSTQAEQVRFSKWTTLVLGLLSIVMGLTLSRVSDGSGTSFVDISFTWLSLVSAMWPVFLLGVASRRATAAHALMTLLISFVVTAAMVWYCLYPPGERVVSFMYVCVPGPALALLIAFTVSRFSPRLPASSLTDLTFWTLRTDDTHASVAVAPGEVTTRG